MKVLFLKSTFMNEGTFPKSTVKSYFPKVWFDPKSYFPKVWFDPKSGTWTQPVLGQDFTVLWLATLGRGINAGARCYASLYWFPYQESVSQILEKKNQDFTGSAPDSLRATYWPGYVLTGLCIHVVAVLYEVLSTSTWLWLLYQY